MKTAKMTLALSLVVALVATSFAWAADGEGGGQGRGEGMRANRGGMGIGEADREKLKDMTPEERREFMRKRMENMTPEQREAARRRREEAAGGGHPLIERFLQENEQFKAAMEAHREAMKDIGEELRALQEATREKMKSKELTKAEREQIVNGAKTQTRALFGKILDERVRFQNVVTKLIEDNREEILDQATDMVFQRGGRGPGQGEMGGRPGNRAAEGGMRGPGKGEMGGGRNRARNNQAPVEEEKEE